MSNDTVTQDEFDGYQRAKKRSFLETHWPRAQKLLMEGKTPREVAAQMANEGYQGFSSSRIGVADIHRLQELSWKEELTERKE